MAAAILGREKFLWHTMASCFSMKFRSIPGKYSKCCENLWNLAKSGSAERLNKSGIQHNFS